MERRRRTAPMLAVLVPSSIVLAVWFFTAPDPRFVFAPLWLVAVALAAWLFPAAAFRPSMWFLLAGAVLGGLIEVGIDHLIWLVPAALLASTLAAAALRIAGKLESLRLVAQVAIVTATLVPIGVVASRGAFAIIGTAQGGSFGTPVEFVPELRTFTTDSGLQVVQPTNTDQCFLVQPCTTDSNSRLRLRGAGISKGFSVEPDRSDNPATTG